MGSSQSTKPAWRTGVKTTVVTRASTRGAARQAGRNIMISLTEPKKHRPLKSTGRQWIRDAEAPRRPPSVRHLPGDLRGVLSRAPPGRHLGLRRQPDNETQLPVVRVEPVPVYGDQHPDWALPTL